MKKLISIEEQLFVEVKGMIPTVSLKIRNMEKYRDCCVECAENSIAYSIQVLLVAV